MRPCVYSWMASLCVTSILAAPKAPASEKSPCQLGDDRELNRCMVDAIYSTRKAMFQGVPSQNIPHLDPLYIDKLDFQHGDGVIRISGSMENTRVEGIGNFTMRRSATNSKAGQFFSEMTIPILKMNGTYSIHVRFIALGLRANGTFDMYFENNTVTGTNNLVTKGEAPQQYVQVADIKQKIKPQNGKIRLHKLLEREPVLAEICHVYLNNNWKDMFEVMSPQVMDHLAKIQKQVLNLALQGSSGIN